MLQHLIVNHRGQILVEAQAGKILEPQVAVPIDLRVPSQPRRSPPSRHRSPEIGHRVVPDFPERSGHAVYTGLIEALLQRVDVDLQPPSCPTSTTS